MYDDGDDEDAAAVAAAAVVDDVVVDGDSGEFDYCLRFLPSAYASTRHPGNAVSSAQQQLCPHSEPSSLNPTP